MIIEDRLSIGARLARTKFPGLDSKVDVLLRRDSRFRNMCEELTELDCAVSTHSTTSADAARCLPTGSQREFD